MGPIQRVVARVLESPLCSGGKTFCPAGLLSSTFSSNGKVSFELLQRCTTEIRVSGLVVRPSGTFSFVLHPSTVTDVKTILSGATRVLLGRPMNDALSLRRYPRHPHDSRTGPVMTDVPC